MTISNVKLMYPLFLLGETLWRNYLLESSTAGADDNCDSNQMQYALQTLALKVK